MLSALLSYDFRYEFQRTRIAMKYRRVGIAFLVLLSAAAVVRAALPGIVKYYVNDELADMQKFTGRVDDVDLSLWAGRYGLDRLELYRRNGLIPEPFLSVPRAEIGLDWSALIHGEWEAKIRLIEPVLTFVDGATPEETQAGTGPDWIAKVKKLAPLTINTFDVVAGQLRLLSTGDAGGLKETLDISQLMLEARNFSNVRERRETLHGTIAAVAKVQGVADAELNVQIDPLARPPELSVDAEVKHLPLTSLNAMLRTYAGVDAHAGSVEAYVEFASANGEFTGYAKPLVQGAEIFWPGERGSFFGKAWDLVVEGVKELFENPSTDQVGAKVPLAGELTAVDAELVPAVFSILKNAFVDALSAGIGHTVSLEDVVRGEEGAEEGRSAT